MKVIAVEGTPEEIARFQEIAEFMGSGAMPQSRRGEPSDWPPGYQQVVRFIRERANPSALPLVARFAERALKTPVRGTYLAGTIGSSKNTPDHKSPYFMILAPGPRHYGAIAYIRPTTGLVTFRLAAADAAGRRFAYPIRQETDHPYQVRLSLRSEETVSEAIELLGLALERVWPAR